MNNEDDKTTNLQLPDFLIVPSILVKDKDIRPLDQLVYGVTYWFKHLKNEKCTLKNKGYAILLGCTVDAVRHSLYRLEQSGYIEIRYKDLEKIERDEIIPMIAFKKQNLPSEMGGGSNEPGGGSNEPGGGSTGPGEGGSNKPQNNIINKKEELNNIIAAVFKRWNELGLIKHRILPKGTIISIERLVSQEVTQAEIIRTIENYATIVLSEEYYFKYRWTLPEFLERGFDKFYDLEGAKQTYRTREAERREKSIYADDL